VAEHLELGGGDGQGLLLEGERHAVDNEEAHQVPRWPDGQVTELERALGPVGERQPPGQVEEARAAAAQPEPRERRCGACWLVRQSFLRRYAVTVAS
jgi:hypothetical protein